MNCCALIPCYRPDEKLLQTIEELKAAGFDKLIAIDDGNGANCAELFAAAREAGAELVVHAVNQGKGRALKSGFNRALVLWPGCAAVTVDADGQHPASAAAEAARLAEEHPDALILGCRKFADSAEMPLPNRLGNGLTKLVLEAVSGLRISDTQCGLRAYPPEVMKKLLSVPGERFEFETETLLAARRERIPIVEFSMEAVYEKKGDYKTTFRKTTDSALIYARFLKFAEKPLAVGGAAYGAAYLLLRRKLSPGKAAALALPWVAEGYGLWVNAKYGIAPKIIKK